MNRYKTTTPVQATFYSVISHPVWFLLYWSVYKSCWKNQNEFICVVQLYLFWLLCWYRTLQIAKWLCDKDKIRLSINQTRKWALCMTLCCWVVKITVRHAELPETNTNIYICQTRIHLSTCCKHWKIIRQHMLNLILVTYDNIVMCFILYLHYSKHDFISGIFLFFFI